MTFQHPLVLWGLLGLIPVALLLYLEYHYATVKIPVLVAPDNRDRFGQRWVRRWSLSSVCFGLFYAAAIVALAGPVWGERYEEEERQGVDILLVLDVSKSMYVSDVPPNRLSRAREVLLGLVSDLQPARLGLLVLRGSANLVVPITEDRRTIEQALNHVETVGGTQPGTDLTAGLQVARRAFPATGNRYQLILLVTDGEDQGLTTIAVAQELGAAGLPVFCVGTGTAEGGVVPGSKGPPSRLEAVKLQAIAEASHGRYLDVLDFRAMNRLAEDIRAYQHERESRGYRLRPVSHEALVTGLALVFLFLSIAVRSLGRWQTQ